MLVLALDTATLVSSVALVTDDKLVAELTVQTKLTHSELLMPHIEQLLQAARVSKQDIGAVAVSIGPGSFTGLRIGLGSAKAMAYAWHVPLIGVPTLQALAYNCVLPGTYLAPMLDAQKGNIYTALYTWERGGLVECRPPAAAALADTIASLAVLDKPVVALGESAVMYHDVLVEAGVLPAAPHLIMPRAASVGLVGSKMLACNMRHDVMGLEPFYIRRSEAEVLWERRQQAALT